MDNEKALLWIVAIVAVVGIFAMAVGVKSKTVTADTGSVRMQANELSNIAGSATAGSCSIGVSTCTGSITCKWGYVGLSTESDRVFYCFDNSGSRTDCFHMIGNGCKVA